MDLPHGMTFGVFLAPYPPVRESPVTTYERDLELIEWCERWGFDEAWVGEHHSAAWENIADPCVFLAAAGQRTHRIRLGSGVVTRRRATHPSVRTRRSSDRAGAA